ncbi:MAG: ribonuclease P protein component [Clostridiales bacterium]|nr:ribonuclease P protein component [Clostridiales bacterium]
MKFTQTLKKNRQFRNVYSRGKSCANSELVLYALANDTNENRLGISVSKKVGKSVVRSRVTRLIRESYRLSEERVAAGNDLVFIARKSAKGAPFAAVQRAMVNLLKKQGLLKRAEQKTLSADKAPM